MVEALLTFADELERRDATAAAALGAIAGAGSVAARYSR
jgi:hypothetical protein